MLWQQVRPCLLALHACSLFLFVALPAVFQRLLRLCETCYNTFHNLMVVTQNADRHGMSSLFLGSGQC